MTSKRYIARRIIVTAFASLLLATSLFVPAAGAATSGANGAPLTSAIIGTGPTYQEVAIGTYATFSVVWSGEPFFNQTFQIHYGDGSSGYYTCYSNCEYGQTVFSYNGYPYTGLWGAWTTDQNFNGSNLTDVVVY